MAGALGDIGEFARSYGRAKGLEQPDGTFVCWRCRTPLEPFHESLHCDWCRNEAVERERAAQAKLAAMPQADRLWISIAERIENDGLSRDAAMRLLEAARQRPDAAPHRLAWADAAFDKRYGQVLPSAGTWTPDDGADWRDR